MTEKEAKMTFRGIDYTDEQVDALVEVLKKSLEKHENDEKKHERKTIELEDFLDMWTRKNRIVILCRERSYDDMFDVVDDINEGKATIRDIPEYVIGAIVPDLSQYKVSYLLSDRWNKAEVTDFFIGETAAIIWIKDGEEE